MNNYQTKAKNYPKTEKKSFFEEFSLETDIFAEKNPFPDWIFDFREQQLTKLSLPTKKLCRNLKALGYGFKIKYPIEIFGKWKFADIYIPKLNTVILVSSSYKEMGRPCNTNSDRAEYFKDKFMVIELFEYNAGDMNVLKKALRIE